MKKYGFKKLIVPGIYFVSVMAVIGCITLTIAGINKYLEEKKDFKYSVNGLIDKKNSDIQPVQGDENKIENNTSEIIIRPYKSDSVSVGRYFYDFEGDAKNQENSIILYENTYMQNSGIDYTNKETFDIVSILDGTVIEVTDNKILGKTIKIKHNNDLISTYQSLSEVSVKENDTVLRGQVIAKSGTCPLYSSDSNLHFELTYQGKLVNPESYYNKSVDEL